MNQSEAELDKKKSKAFKALFFKNLTLQSRQPLTTLCTIITPIICIVFTTLIQKAIYSVLPDQSESLLTKYPFFPFLLNNVSVYDTFSQYINKSPLEWYQYQAHDQETLSFLGQNDGHSEPTGMLKNLPIITNKDKCPFNSSFTPPFHIQHGSCPFFRRTINSTLNEDLFKRYLYLNDLNYQQNKNTSSLDKLSDGGINFLKANNKTLLAELKINDLRNFDYHRCDGITEIGLRYNKTSKFQYYYITSEGMLSLMDLVNRAYIKTLYPQKGDFSSGYIYMPIEDQTKGFIEIIINTVSTILFPLSLSLLFPVFLYNIVLEKEEKLIQMMRMNGMGIGQYWFNNCIFNLFLSILTNLTFCLFGYFFMNGGIFYSTSWVLITVTLMGWIFAQIGMSVFFQVFLSNSRAANIIGYLLSIWTNLIGATFSVAIYQYPRQLPFALSLYPTFSFNRLFYIFFSECSADHCISSISNISPQVERCIVSMYISGLIFLLLGIYLFQVIPQQFGVRQPLLFPLSKIRQIFQRREYKKLDKHKSNQQIEMKSDKKNSDELASGEKRKIRSIQNPQEYALICSGLRKVYENGKVAVTGLDLVVKDHQIFGLLGPNGAGKTTLISMITGIFSPSRGIAYIGGRNIIDEIDLVHLNMGVCPQFDILWPQLTVEQHLYFYARLKGVQRKKEDEMVKQAMEQVNLLPFSKFKSKKLSGGMKRRLSVGISLVGNPRIVFLDEPTTGLDPQNRRQLWQVMAKLKQKRSLFLTTHLMEQANTLCNRIGIITNGTLRTVGEQFELKKKYGKGYFLSITLDLISKQLQQDEQIENQRGLNYSQVGLNHFEQDKNSVLSISQTQELQPAPIIDKYKQQLNRKATRIKQVIFALFPHCKLDKQINGFLRFGMGEIIVSEVLKKIGQVQERQIKEGWGISNSNLEDVFIEVVNRFQINQEQSEQRQFKEMSDEVGFVSPLQLRSLAQNQDSEKI